MKNRTRQAWKNMKLRCHNPKARQYSRYGGRGIKVCDRWSGYKNFLEDMGECPGNFQLDRIDNDGDYTPSNCRWVSPQENRQNRKIGIRSFTINGVTRCLWDWAKEYRIKYPTVRKRLSNGWPIEDALRFPIEPGRRYSNRVVPVKILELEGVV